MPHRTLQEWEALKAEMREDANQRPPLPEDQIEVKVTYLQEDGSIRKEYHRAPTVTALQAEGYRVLINHKRYTERKPLLKGFPLPKDERRALDWRQVKAKGGATHVILLAPEHGAWAEGHAICVVGDPYSRKVGYVLAVNKALAQLNGG